MEQARMWLTPVFATSLGFNNRKPEAKTYENLFLNPGLDISKCLETTTFQTFGQPRVRLNGQTLPTIYMGEAAWLIWK